MAHEVAAASRELRADGREDAENQYLRYKQQRIRQQTGLPVVHRRQERRQPGDDQELAEDAEREQGQQEPEQRGARPRFQLSPAEGR